MLSHSPAIRPSAKPMSPFAEHATFAKLVGVESGKSTRLVRRRHRTLNTSSIRQRHHRGNRPFSCNKASNTALALAGARRPLRSDQLVARNGASPDWGEFGRALASNVGRDRSGDKSAPPVQLMFPSTKPADRADQIDLGSSLLRAFASSRRRR